RRSPLLLLSRPRPHRPLHSFPTRRSSDLTANSGSSETTRSSSTLAPVLTTQANLPGSRWCRSSLWDSTTVFSSAKIPENPQSDRSEEHTSELQSRFDLVCRLLLEKKNNRQ